MMGISLNASLLLKWVQASFPYLSLILVFLISALFFGYSLKVLEGPLYSTDESMMENKIDFRYIENCVWTIMVSMTTVGYGDFYPHTNLGRVVIVGSTLVGNALISLFVFSLERSFNLEPQEQAAYSFSERLDFKQKIETQSIRHFFNGFRFEHAKNEYFKSRRQRESIQRQNDKRSEMLAFLLDKIWSKKHFKQSFKFFRNNFDQYNMADLIKSKIEEVDDSLEAIEKGFDFYEKKCDRLEEELDEKDEEIEKLKSQLQSMDNTVTEDNEALTPSVCHSELREFIDDQW